MTTKPTTISYCQASGAFYRNGKQITIRTALRIWLAHNAHWTSEALDKIIERAPK